jgi:hypothetical protein
VKRATFAAGKELLRAAHARLIQESSAAATG